ncbi:hypothetical protein ACWD1W_35915 [Streptomyces olivaceoviridis]
MHVTPDADGPARRTPRRDALETPEHELLPVAVPACRGASPRATNSLALSPTHRVPGAARTRARAPGAGREGRLLIHASKKRQLQ